MKKSMKNETENKKHTFHHYLWYMIIFSLIGVLIETIFGYITTGKLESRKGLILGPLCPVYGCGAVLIIALLDRYKGHKIKLFVYGTILGAAIEYIISFILEAIYGARFWDYSWAAFNINGRICLSYSIFWGILTLLLIEFGKKYIDKLINKIQGKARIITDTIVTIILVLDIVITVWGITVYQIRAKETLNGKNYISNNNIIEKFQNTAFSNEIMSTIFPNLRIVDNEGNLIFIKDIFNK
ncbi:MAG: putative ABC transporter permease [Clostridia bacterium]